MTVDNESFEDLLLKVEELLDLLDERDREERKFHIALAVLAAALLIAIYGDRLVEFLRALLFT